MIRQPFETYCPTYDETPPAVALAHQLGRSCIVDVGDRVRDPMDGEWRTVTQIVDTTVYMEDGGCMGIEECAEATIALPSEDINDPVFSD